MGRLTCPSPVPLNLYRLQGVPLLYFGAMEDPAEELPYPQTVSRLSFPLYLPLQRIECYIILFLFSLQPEWLGYPGIACESSWCSIWEIFLFPAQKWWCFYAGAKVIAVFNLIFSWGQLIPNLSMDELPGAEAVVLCPQEKGLENHRGWSWNQWNQCQRLSSFRPSVRWENTPFSI